MAGLLMFLNKFSAGIYQDNLEGSVQDKGVPGARLQNCTKLPKQKEQTIKRMFNELLERNNNVN